MNRRAKMIYFLQWCFVISISFASAYYLNWISYGPAASLDGRLISVLRMGVNWYGIPLCIVVQLAIWWVMPTLYKITPSPWLAAVVWPMLSAISKIIVLWKVKPPTKGDWIAIGALLTATIVGWAAKAFLK